MLVLKFWLRKYRIFLLTVPLTVITPLVVTHYCAKYHWLGVETMGDVYGCWFITQIISFFLFIGGTEIISTSIEKAREEAQEWEKEHTFSNNQLLKPDYAHKREEE